MGIKTPFFPYTFDYGGQRGNDCPVQPCLTDEQVFPGFWEVPMNDLNVVYTVKGGLSFFFLKYFIIKSNPQPFSKK